MRYLRSFGRFWWDFVLGDDWRLAAGVVAGLTVTRLLVDRDAPSWWALPLAVIATLAVSLRRAVR